MQVFQYGRSGSLTILFSGEINSLGYSGARLAGVDYNNASGYTLAEMEFLGGAPQSYTAGAAVSVWLLRCVVSGTYEDGASGFIPGRAPDVSLPLVSGTSRTTKMFRLPPETMRPLFMNIGGVALAASGNLVRLLPRRYESVSG